MTKYPKWNRVNVIAWAKETMESGTCQSLADTKAFKGRGTAQVLRQLAHAGIKVERRAWGPAEAAGASPSLLLLTAPVPDGLAAQAAERLQAHTGARVRRLRVEDFGAQQFE